MQLCFVSVPKPSLYTERGAHLGPANVRLPHCDIQSEPGGLYDNNCTLDDPRENPLIANKKQTKSKKLN